MHYNQHCLTWTGWQRLWQWQGYRQPQVQEQDKCKRHPLTIRILMVGSLGVLIVAWVTPSDFLTY
ncbi:UNVERIFIED_CONTAM: hypothetical protein NY603_26475, partial [Bacteroidetes bacterium 56_B9]